MKREILAVVATEENEFDLLIGKYNLPKVLRIGAWIQCFIDNGRVKPRDRKCSPVETEEVQRVKLWWIRRAQLSARQDARFEADQLRLNLQLNEQQIIQRRGRIDGEYPIYLPDNHLFTTSLVERAHISTLHGGVGITMAKIREQIWVPRLRQLVKKVRSIIELSRV